MKNHHLTHFILLFFLSITLRTGNAKLVVLSKEKNNTVTLVREYPYLLRTLVKGDWIEFSKKRQFIFLSRLGKGSTSQVFKVSDPERAFKVFALKIPKYDFKRRKYPYKSLKERVKSYTTQRKIHKEEKKEFKARNDELLAIFNSYAVAFEELTALQDWQNYLVRMVESRVPEYVLVDLMDEVINFRLYVATLSGCLKVSPKEGRTKYGCKYNQLSKILTKLFEFAKHTAFLKEIPDLHADNFSYIRGGSGLRDSWKIFDYDEGVKYFDSNTPRKYLSHTIFDRSKKQLSDFKSSIKDELFKLLKDFIYNYREEVIYNNSTYTVKEFLETNSNTKIFRKLNRALNI